MPRPRARVILESETETSSDSGDENIQPTQATCGSQPTKRKVVITQYTTSWKFASNAEFDDFWEDESANWINRSSHSSKKTGAYIQYLDCKYRERLESNCPKKLKIIKKDGVVTVDTSSGDHQGHNEHGDVLTAKVKEKIKELMADGRTPAQIRNKLQDFGLYVPMLEQVENFVWREKRKSGLHAPFTDMELHNYCQEFSPNNVRGRFSVRVTNNGLEALNKVTKELDMERKRVSFRGFVQVVEKVIQRWSTLPDYQDVKSRPKITPHTFFLAYQLKREKRVQVPNEDSTWAYVASTKNKDYTAEDIADKVESLERHEFDTWEAFKELRFGVHFIEQKDDWYRCSCRIGVKKVLCKHAVRLMCTKKMLEYPPDAMAEPVEERRRPKRGRPSKVKPLQVRY